MGNNNSLLIKNNSNNSNNSKEEEEENEIELNFKKVDENERFINMVQDFLVTSKKMVKKENKRFLKNQEEFIKLVSDTLNESKYCSEISKEISNDLKRIRKNLIIAEAQINSTATKSMLGYQLNIDIDNLQNTINIGGKKSNCKISSMKLLKEQIERFELKIRNESDGLFYRKLFKFFGLQHLLKGDPKNVKLLIAGIGGVPATIISASVILTVGLSTIPITIPISVFLIGATCTLLYLISRSMNTHRMYIEFAETIKLISSHLGSFIKHLSINTNSMCVDLKNVVNELQKNNEVPALIVDVAIQTIDRILDRIKIIDSLSDSLKSLETLISKKNDDGSILKLTSSFSSSSMFTKNN